MAMFFWFLILKGFIELRDLFKAAEAADGGCCISEK